MPLLYEDIDQFSSDCIEKLDKELLNVSNNIKQLFPEKNLVSLRSLYDTCIDVYKELISDKTNLKSVIATCKA